MKHTHITDAPATLSIRLKHAPQHAATQTITRLQWPLTGQAHLTQAARAEVSLRAYLRTRVQLVHAAQMHHLTLAVRVGVHLIPAARVGVSR